MSYSMARRRLDRLLRISELLTAEIEEAAQDVIEAAKQKAVRRASDAGTGPVTAYQGDDFVRYIERAWRQARNDDARAHVRAMITEGETHRILSSEEARELRRRFAAGSGI